MMKHIIRAFVMGGLLGCSTLFAHQTNSTDEQTQTKKMRRVYIDMVGDLFHVGHINAIKNARKFGDYLIVGVCGDEACTSYKRLPILTHEERVAAIKACRYVDEVIPNAPVAVTAEFIDEHNIDVVVHGDDFDQAKMRKYYGDAMDRGIL